MDVKPEWVDISLFPRKDLIEWVYAHCVCIPDVVSYKDPKVAAMQEWCHKHLGRPRDGHIVKEAMDGWLDYYEGDWDFLYDDLHNNGDWVFWFARISDKVQFELTWL